ncbi:MAG: type II toxin-antitoxin system RelE family toxin [Sulfuricurvum sp.]
MYKSIGYYSAKKELSSLDFVVQKQLKEKIILLAPDPF